MSYEGTQQTQGYDAGVYQQTPINVPMAPLAGSAPQAVAMGKVAPLPQPDMSGDPVIVFDQDAVAQWEESHINGLDCDSERAFARDLAPGEQIEALFAVRANLRFRTWRFWLAVILTLGLYYIWAWCAGQCRKSVTMERAKLAVTTHGRVLLWRAQAFGVVTGLCCKNRRVAAYTTVEAYSISKLSSVDRQYRRWLPFCGLLSCVEKSDVAVLRLAFGNFPDSAAMSFSSITGLPSQVYASIGNSMRPHTTAASHGLIETLFSIIRMVVNTIYMVVQSIIMVVQSAVEYAGLGTYILTIASDDNDDRHDKKNASGSEWNALMLIESRILTHRRSRDPVGSRLQATRLWEEVNGASVPMIRDGKALVSRADINLQPDEQIIDAYPFEIKMTLMDLLKSIATVGIYYFTVVTKKLGTTGYIVLTRRRVIEVMMKCSSPEARPNNEVQLGCCNDTMLFVVRSWYINRLSQGSILITKHYVRGDFKVGRTGWLHIQPFYSPEMCDCGYSCGLGLPIEVSQNMVTFLSHFTDYEGLQPMVQPPPTEVALPDGSPLVHWRPFPDERPVHLFRSFKDLNCEENCLRCGSCGRFPHMVKQDLLVSTHRVWWVESETNAPWCCEAFFNPRIERIYWRPIRQFKYLRIKAHANYMTGGCCTGCCGFPTWATVQLGAQGSFPVWVNHSTSTGQRGILETQPINQFREFMAWILSQAEQNRKSRV